MRKSIIALILAILMVTALLGGCSCIGESPINFNNKFYGADISGDPPAGYKETLTYKVTYSAQHPEGIGRSPFLQNASFDFKDGLYVSTLETVTTLPYGIQSDIIDNLPVDAKTLYKLTTKLSITSCYQGLTDGDKEYQDFIESTVYFCSYRLSYAPIYSFVKTDYSLFFYSEDGCSVGKLQSERTINYSQEKYVITEKVGEEVTTSEYEYKFRTIIDNAQLLFALRNIDVVADNNFYLPTVSYAYGQAKNLLVQNKTQTYTPVEITNNGVLVDEDIPITTLSFMINDTTKAGVSQFVSIQKASSNGLAFNSLLYSYVEPISEYGQMLTMGCLEYTLAGV
ncbi:MAG: hypothetical protein J6R83_02345, partial [Clostridia bacterium]|nr:hypothetical protein [Clostridia bacterium]